MTGRLPILPGPLPYALVEKTIGPKAIILESSDPRIPLKGLMLSNPLFEKYSGGEKLIVRFEFSKTGRRFIHSIVRAGEVGSEQKEPAVNPAPKVPPLPPSLDGYFVSAEVRMSFTVAHSMSLANPSKPIRIMMVGPSGFGKTTIPMLFASVTGRRFYRMNCGSIRDPEEWFGYREARDSNTVFIRSEFIKTVEAGNVVVVLDEFNRLEPWLHNTLFPLLDDAGRTVVHDEEFTIGPNVIFVGTINTGYRYTGTFELDEALSNRFDFLITVGPMPYEDEVNILKKRTGINATTAASIVKMANILRQREISCPTRSSLSIASMVKNGLTVREAFEYAIVHRIPSDDGSVSLKKTVLDLLVTQLGAFETREMPNDVFKSSLAKDGGSLPDDKVDTEAKTKFGIMIRYDGGSAELNFVGTIRTLQEVTSFMPEGRLSLSEARKLAVELREGKSIELLFPDKPSNLEDIIKELKSMDLAGKYGER